MEDKEVKLKINAREELDNINSKTIFEFEKTIDNFEIEKIKALVAKDDNRTVSLLFYDNDFFAIDRVNFKNGYDYNSKRDYEVISENLNHKIKKIPNVAKTRKILNIEDIETRIYDISEYIVLLKKEDVKLLKVNNQDDISELVYAEYTLNKSKIEEQIQEYQEIEDEEIREENSFKNRIKRITDSTKHFLISLKNKLLKTNEVKMLSDGKHSIFEKED